MKVWYEQITQVRSWHELLEVARTYLSSLSPQEWASVPASCRPDRIKGIDDLDHWQQCLANAYLEVAADDSATETHREMLAFFTAAAERAAEMVGRATSPGTEATNDHSSDAPLRASNGKD